MYSVHSSANKCILVPNDSEYWPGLPPEYINLCTNYNNSNKYHANVRKKFEHCVIYISSDVAKKVLNHSSEMLIHDMIKINKHFRGGIECISVCKNKQYEYIKEIYVIDDAKYWSKLVKILLLSPVRICINYNICINDGKIYDIKYTHEIIKQGDYDCLITEKYKTYTSPYPKNNPDYDTLSLLFEETLYKLSSKYKAIEARTLGYFFTGLRLVCKSKKLIDISVKFCKN
jgi:hypothetical protein